jgi:transcriptional regulator with XRE-family HTH domain
MLIDGKYALSNEPNGFPARLRHVLDSYGTGIALAQAIGRSEGAIRKWLRGESEPNVSDLRAICEATNTNVEWLVFGRGDPKRMEIRESPCIARAATSCSRLMARGYAERTRRSEAAPCGLPKAQNPKHAQYRRQTDGAAGAPGPAPVHHFPKQAL